MMGKKGGGRKTREPGVEGKGKKGGVVFGINSDKWGKEKKERENILLTERW